MIDHESVLAWKVDQLNGSTQQPMSDAMQAYVECHHDLQQQLQFMQQFWQVPPAPISVPSARMRNRFDAMLNEQQRHVHGATSPQARPGVSSLRESKWLARISQWLAGPAIYQLSALALVFVLGMWVNQQNSQSEQRLQLSALQQDVSSLSTFIAISMLQKSSASERLTGVAYSRQSDLSNPVLSDTLFALLETDKSTAVRMAVINTLQLSGLSPSNQQRLIALAINESNPLVQMALSRLLLAYGSSATKRQLLGELNQHTLNPDVAEFIQSLQDDARI